MTDGAAARTEAMNWATRTARLGEDPLAVLARAQLYEEYILSGAKASLTPVRSSDAIRSE